MAVHVHPHQGERVEVDGAVLDQRIETSCGNLDVAVGGTRHSTARRIAGRSNAPWPKVRPPTTRSRVLT
ncbi:MAG: hypothetical protein ABI611_17980 [Solirubrobacteraceae bacterium]